MFDWLDAQGSQYLAFGLVAVFVVLSIVCLWAIQRWLPMVHFRECNDLGEIFSDAIGGMFSLLFALVIVAAWQNFDRVRSAVGSEATTIYNIYEDLAVYPPEVRTPCQALIRQYVHQVATVEWKVMKDGKEDPVSRKLFTRFNRAILAFKPSPAEAPIHTEVMRLVSTLRALRSDRIDSTEPFLDYSMCLSLIVSAATYVVYSCFYHTENQKAYRVMIGFLGVALGLVFYMLLNYNQAFTGSILVSPRPFQELESGRHILQ